MLPLPSPLNPALAMTIAKVYMCASDDCAIMPGSSDPITNAALFAGRI